MKLNLFATKLEENYTYSIVRYEVDYIWLENNIYWVDPEIGDINL